MRRLGRILSRGRPGKDTLQLTAAELRPGSAQPQASGGSGCGELAREISAVADYVARLKREIAALRPRELHRERLPEMRRELSGIDAAGRSAAERIMAAAEAIIETELQGEQYRDLVEREMTAIIEACSFPDIVGQQLTRIGVALGGMETRLERFTGATRVPDGTGGLDRTALIQEARRDILMVEGPQEPGAGVEQRDVDKVFA